MFENKIKNRLEKSFKRFTLNRWCEIRIFEAKTTNHEKTRCLINRINFVFL